MNTAQNVRLAKERNPAAYCVNPKCLWRVLDREGNRSPCPKHMQSDQVVESIHTATLQMLSMIGAPLPSADVRAGIVRLLTDPTVLDDCAEADECSCRACRSAEAMRPTITESVPTYFDRLAAIDEAVEQFLSAERCQAAACQAYRESVYRDEMAAQNAEDAYRLKLKAADRVAELLGIVPMAAARKE